MRYYSSHLQRTRIVDSTADAQPRFIEKRNLNETCFESGFHLAATAAKAANAARATKAARAANAARAAGAAARLIGRNSEEGQWISFFSRLRIGTEFRLVEIKSNPFFLCLRMILSKSN